MFAWKKSNNKRGLRKDMDKLNLKIHTRRKNWQI